MKFDDLLNDAVKTKGTYYHSSYDKISSLEVGHGRFGVHVGSEETAQNRADLKKVEVIVNQGRDIGNEAFVHEVEVSYQKALRMPEYILDDKGVAGRAMNWSPTEVLNMIADLKDLELQSSLGFNKALDFEMSETEIDDMVEQCFKIPDSPDFDEEFIDQDIFMLAEEDEATASRVMQQFLKHYAGCDAIIYENAHEGGGDSLLLLSDNQVELTGVIKSFDTTDSVARVNAAYEKAKADPKRGMKMGY